MSRDKGWWSWLSRVSPRERPTVDLMRAELLAAALCGMALPAKASAQSAQHETR